MRFVSEDDVHAAPAPEGQFTPGVWRSELLPPTREQGLRAHRFSYDPGARSYWHSHDGEQAIFVLTGRGVIARCSEAGATVVGPGAWVHVEPGEKHWHGAMADDVFVHVAVTASGGTAWHESVTDAEYRQAVGD